MQILEFVKTKGIEVKFHGRAKNEASHYCGQCEVSHNCITCLSTEADEIVFLTIYRLKCLTFSSFANKRRGTWCIAWAAPGSNHRRCRALSVSKSTNSLSSCRSTTPSCFIDRHPNRCSCHLPKPPHPSCNNNKFPPCRKMFCD